MTRPMKTEAIKRFLTVKTVADLAELYNFNMECQVNVAQGCGERVSGQFKGRDWVGWTDGLETWKAFRIPWKAKTEPEYTDSPMNFDLVTHVEGIGMTGWDWKNKVSKWVAFDFDAIIGHSDQHKKKLTPAEMNEVKKTAQKIPWVTVRKSTSGSGLHLYVFLNDIPTANHTEHAALARAVIGLLSAETGFDFSTKVDVCGGNMWVWHRKMAGTDGLKLISQGEVLKNIPPNWRDHLDVVLNKTQKILPNFLTEKQKESFENLTSLQSETTLDAAHTKLIDWLQENNAAWWWDTDNGMLVTHTIHLKEAHETLQMRGMFDTISSGKDKGADINCFAFPLRNGAWSIRRYTKGVAEHSSWDQDGLGWTRCYLNKDPDLKCAASFYEGIENENGNFVFQHGELAAQAIGMLGANAELPTWMGGRPTVIKKHKDGKRIIVEVERNDRDSAPQGWLLEKNKWKRIFNINSYEAIGEETYNYDEIIRHLTSESGKDQGWMVNVGSEWRTEPFQHVKVALESLGLNTKDVKTALGSNIFKSWKIINRPFQPEYLGDRQWNRGAPQLRIAPTVESELLTHPTWDKVLNHCGKNLDDFVLKDGWCKANGIVKGGEYLMCWITAILKDPMEPLPYLFFYGPQDNGKSTFHEAINLLVTKGVIRADTALTDKNGFNGELATAVLCVVEEVNLSVSKMAYNRIKDWVTAKELPIRALYKELYHTTNTTHWVQCANDYTYCPIFTGDTRITMVYVDPIDPIDLIPKSKLMSKLEHEASDFLASCLNLELPTPNGRLRIPVIHTDDKTRAGVLNESLLEQFIREQCVYIPGQAVKYGVLWDEFRQWADPDDIMDWTKQRMGKELSMQYPKGRSAKNNQIYIGNIWVKDVLKPDKEPPQGGKKIVCKNNVLVYENGENIYV